MGPCLRTKKKKKNTCKNENPNHILPVATKQNTNERNINPQQQQQQQNPGNELLMLHSLIKNLHRDLLLRSMVIAKEKPWKILCFCESYTSATSAFTQKTAEWALYCTM